MWKNIGAEQATDGNIARRVRISCWIIKATNTHSEYVVFIAFLQQQIPQQLLHERDLVLRYTSIACTATNYEDPWREFAALQSVTFHSRT